MKDPYETLGVTRSATDKEIKSAFKKLARKFHPDLHPGDKEAETKFKAISAANDLLKDKEKRRRFDAGEIDTSGAERPQERFYRDFADGPAYTSHAAQDGFDSNEGPILIAEAPLCRPLPWISLTSYKPKSTSTCCCAKSYWLGSEMQHRTARRTGSG
ncbi:curved DNA-binding protein CbpA [Bradyrhizobium japonicum]